MEITPRRDSSQQPTTTTPIIFEFADSSSSDESDGSSSKGRRRFRRRQRQTVSQQTASQKLMALVDRFKEIRVVKSPLTSSTISASSEVSSLTCCLEPCSDDDFDVYSTDNDCTSEQRACRGTPKRNE